MAVEVEIDVGLLKSEIRRRTRRSRRSRRSDFIFPTGRAWAEDLGYPAELAHVPDAAVESFAGVANPFRSAGSSRASACSTSAAAPAPTRWSPPRWSASRAASPAST